jgi:tRNA pseudouridine55 synthase
VLGCGAHVTQLRRTQVASYPYERMLTLEQLECIFEQAKAESIRRGSSWIRCCCRWTPPWPPARGEHAGAVAAYVNQGQAVQVAGAPQSGQVRMTVGPEREFIGVGEIDDEGRVAPKRLVIDEHDEE